MKKILTLVSLHTSKFLLAILAVCSFLLYYKTLLPGLGYTGDTAKFQFIGKILGIPHAPGYPLYCLINHVFVLIPIGSIAFRANLMSAFFSVLTLLFLYLLNRAISVNAFSSFIATLFFAFSLTFWSQSVVAEVYTMNSFFLVLVMFLLIKWSKTRHDSYFYSCLFFYIVSFSHHLTMATIFPAVLVFLLVVEPKILFRVKTVLTGMAGLITLGALYSYLFIRTLQDAPYLEHRVRNLKAFFLVISGKQFRSNMFGFSFQDLLKERIPMAIQQLLSELPLALWAIILIGAVVLSKKEKRIFFLLVIGIAGEVGYVLNYKIPDISVYFIPAVLLFTPFLGAGLTYLTEKAKFSKALLLGFYILLVMNLFIMTRNNYSKNDMSQDFMDDIHLSALFENIPDDAVIITDNYQDKLYVYYKTIVDFPQKPVVHLKISSENDIRQEICNKLPREVQRNKKSLPKESMEEYFQNMYLISEGTREAFQKQGLPTQIVYFAQKKYRRKFAFFQVFLDEGCQ